jgi:exopolysaccharide production protein ExoZ
MNATGVLSSTVNTRFVGIQGLRFIAALMVVLTHATLMIGERIFGIGDTMVWREGSAGVDIFFVISGFVMAISSRSLIGRADGAHEFMVRRLLRIVPLYWIATTLKLFTLVAVPALALHSALEPGHVLSSYLFIPWHNVEGEVKPLVSVGWTLTFEMFFYLLFAVGLLMRIDPLRFVLPALLLLAVLGNFRSPDDPAVFVYFDAILLEFGLGLIAARIILRGFHVPAPVGLIAVALGFAALFLPPELYGDTRALGWGVPSFVIVLFTAAMEPALARVLGPKVEFLGDSSYALYLFHTFYVPLTGVALVKLGLGLPWLALTVAVIGSIAIGAVVHATVERPIGRWLGQWRQRHRDGRRTRAAAIAT